MFRLIRFVFSLLFFVAVLWFATNVKLGRKTLWQHLQAIFATKEAHELAEGTKEEARRVAERLRSEATDLGLNKHQAAPLDPMPERDRKALDKLVKEKVK